MKKKILLPIFLVSITLVSTIIFYLYRQNQVARASSPKVISVSAKLAGDNGSLISVEYQTDDEMSVNFETNQTYLIVQSSGKRLSVQWASYIGPLISQSVGKTYGWFVIDNSELDVTNGTQVTIIIGDFTKENYEVTWP